MTIARPRRARDAGERAAGGKGVVVMPQTISERLHTFEDDHVWVDENRDTLLAEYAEEWVAVEGKRVIDHDPDFFSLIARMPHRGHTCVQFLTRDRLVMLL